MNSEYPYNPSSGKFENPYKAETKPDHVTTGFMRTSKPLEAFQDPLEIKVLCKTIEELRKKNKKLKKENKSLNKLVDELEEENTSNYFEIENLKTELLNYKVGFMTLKNQQGSNQE